MRLFFVATKAGVKGYSRVFAKELAPFNVTVNCIAPGPIRTNLLKGVDDKQISEIVEQQIINQEMKPSAVIEIARLLLSDESRDIRGEVINVGGIWCLLII